MPVGKGNDCICRCTTSLQFSFQNRLLDTTEQISTLNKEHTGLGFRVIVGYSADDRLTLLSSDNSLVCFIFDGSLRQLPQQLQLLSAGLT